MKLSQRLAIGYIRTKFKILSALSATRAAENAFHLFCTPYLKSKPYTPAVFEHAERLSFNLNNKNIHGFRWNYPQQQKVLILHGFGSAAHKFHHLVQPLIDKGYEVLAFDAPAHGLSDGNTVNVIDYCAMIKQVMLLYGPIDNFIAHSFGGIAVSLALEEIEHPVFTKVVLIAPATETLSAVNGAFDMLRLNNKKVRTAFDNIILKIIGKEAAWFSIRRAVKNITASILWIHDEDDDITPFKDVIQVKNDNPPNIKFVITKGLGHKRIYRDKDVKEIIMGFL
ncbi:MAG: alpha/beta hydrolase [Chitinophagaceae bacterium]|nr:alpha/beta hydrolase [Chitinophagaceae bacterium]